MRVGYWRADLRQLLGRGCPGFLRSGQLGFNLMMPGFSSSSGRISTRSSSRPVGQLFSHVHLLQSTLSVTPPIRSFREGQIRDSHPTLADLTLDAVAALKGCVQAGDGVGHAQGHLQRDFCSWLVTSSRWLAMRKQNHRRVLEPHRSHPEGTILALQGFFSRRGRRTTDPKEAR